MTDKSKNIWGYLEKFMKIAGFLGALGFAVGVFIGYGKWVANEENYKEGVEERIFIDEVELQKHRDHVNTETNPITLFRQRDTLTKITDTVSKQQKTLKIQLKNTDSLVGRLNKRIDSIRTDKIKENKEDSVTEIKRNKSREERTRKIDLILENQLRILDTIN